MITVLTAIPLLGALVVGLLLPQRIARGITLAVNFACLGLAAYLWATFDASIGTIQFEERYSWIPSLHVEYRVGIDGLGLLMVLLAAFVVPFAVLASRDNLERPHVYYSLLLCLQGAMFGAFTALNFVHWFVFWELCLVPAYFLIKLWGKTQGASAAALQFFIYTLVGSITLLLGFAAIYLATETFDFLELAQLSPSFSSPMIAASVFWGIFLGFAIKVPLFPFHTWVPAAYGQAPPAVTMVLTGVMSKLGLYGFLRILAPIFPGHMQSAATLLLALAVASIVFSALAAFSQPDLRRMMAYSSINHLGYCLLGLFAAAKLTGGEVAWLNEKAAAINGVLLQMFNHGVTAAALFCFVEFLERRTGTSEWHAFGGLRKAAPIFCGTMGIAIFASLGLPGLSGFVGEFLVFKGAFALAAWAAAVACLGLLVTAIFLLAMTSRIWHGPARRTDFIDLSPGERWTIAPALALIFAFGLFPDLLTRLTNPTVQNFLAQLTR